MDTTNASLAGEDSVYATLENYNWDDDVEFQSGLQAILGSNSTPEQVQELTLRARCFYYSRKFNTPLDFNAYKTYRDTHPVAPISPPKPLPSTPAIPETLSESAPSAAPSATPTSSATSAPSAPPALPAPSSNSGEKAPYPSSFAHIIELITTGQPIPGIKEIPDTVLTGQASEPVKPKRRKPWEKDEVETGAGAEQAEKAEQGTAV